MFVRMYVYVGVIGENGLYSQVVRMPDYRPERGGFDSAQSDLFLHHSKLMKNYMSIFMPGT